MSTERETFPWRYGAKFWRVERADGTELGLNADRVTVEAGALCFWRTAIWEAADKPRIPLTEPELYYALAPGTWVEFWAASVYTGEPVSREWCTRARTAT